MSLKERPTRHDLMGEIADLRARLEEAEETLRAIRHGEVDALLVSGPNGAQVFTLESAEQPYRILIEQMQEGAVTVSQEGLILYCNLRFAQMLRVPHEKVIASPVQSYIFPAQSAQFAALLRLGAVQSARAEITLCTAEGSRLPTYITASPLPVEVDGCLCMVVTDLTEQESMRRNQKEIEELNAQLRRSMTETHHRVKNNLQIIAAMIDMQVLAGEQTLPTAEFVRLGQQVRTLAVVHDLLTAQAKRDGEAHSISARTMLEKLLVLLQSAAGERRIRATIEEAELSARQGTGLALLTNELVSNALKHGVGEVDVTFTAHDGRATLQVCDDGPGFPPDFDIASLETTGLGLVEGLSRRDLGGTARYENRPQGGAKVIITMPLN